MNKIINWKKYDTETAKKLGHWEEHKKYVEEWEWDHIEENLYQKETGEFFYHKIYHRGKEQKESIELCYDELEAMTWAAKHLTGEQYEEIFGEVEE